MTAAGTPGPDQGPGTPPEAPEVPTDPDVDRSVGELVFDVSERIATLVREEVELAKAEVGAKVNDLVRGSVVGIAAGIFVVGALMMIMFAVAHAINDLLGIETAIWAGFLIEAGLLLVIAAIAGLVAYRAVKKGAPPTPDMAIEEAKLTKETLEGGRS